MAMRAEWEIEVERVMRWEVGIGGDEKGKERDVL